MISYIYIYIHDLIYIYIYIWFHIYIYDLIYISYDIIYVYVYIYIYIIDITFVLCHDFLGPLTLLGACLRRMRSMKSIMSRYSEFDGENEWDACYVVMLCDGAVVAASPKRYQCFWARWVASSQFSHFPRGIWRSCHAPAVSQMTPSTASLTRLGLEFGPTNCCC